MNKLYFFLLSTFLTLPLGSQDSLSRKHLEPLCYDFDVVDGKLVGRGAEVLKEEVAKAQYTMIGEFHGSKTISDFTTALIPILDNNSYKTMLLEVGPISGQLLNSIESNWVENIKDLHDKYKIECEDEDESPIPFISYVEDAHFIAEAKKEIGIFTVWIKNSITVIKCLSNCCMTILKMKKKT